MQDDDNLSLPSRRSDPYKAKKSWRARIGPLARAQLRRFPLIEAPVKKIWRSVKQGFFGCKWELQALTGSLRGTYASGIDVDKTCWVSPQRIVFSSLQEFNFRDFRGHIIGGDWDRLDKKFDDLDVCVAFRQVCQEGKGWAETIFYQRVLSELNKGHILWGCESETDLKQRCKSLESLFHSIQCEGYKSQRELFLAGRIQDPLEAEEEVTVSIGRHGDLLFCDGAHRLAIAKLLGVPRIPVKVAVRHPKWIKFRCELLLYVREEGGKIYQPITHPDLDDIPAFHNCEDRFRLIKENMSARSGRLLDIGAYLGYFCHRFEEEGFDCCAIEDNPSRVYFLERLARAENRKFKTISESVLDCHEIRNTHYNVVLALNIFHHFLKTRESYDKFILLLKNLQTEELFFESYCAEEQMPDAYKNHFPDEFVKLIMDNSSLKNVDFVGAMEDGRPLYRLY